jgi:hypothetical protein
MSLHDTPAGSLGLVDERAIDNGDPVFTKEELDNFDIMLLRNLAAEANTNAIHGKSTKFEIKSYFRCQRNLTEYE